MTMMVYPLSGGAGHRCPLSDAEHDAERAVAARGQRGARRRWGGQQFPACHVLWSPRESSSARGDTRCGGPCRMKKSHKSD
eukprot:gene926-biopygen7349